MRLRAAFVVGLAVLLAPLALAAEPQYGWEGFGPGSYTVMKMTTKMEMPGMPSPEQVIEVRHTLVRVTADEWVVKNETKMGEMSMPATEMSIPRKAGPVPGVNTEGQKPEDLGTEDVTVEGKKYSTKKTRMKIPGGGTITMWASADEGTLKTETVQSGTTSTMEVTSLAKKTKAAGREFTCREMKTTMSGPEVKGTTVMLMSPEVPMGIVRSESTNDMGAMKSKGVTELTAFEKKAAQ